MASVTQIFAISDTHFSETPGQSRFWRWLYWAAGQVQGDDPEMPLQKGYDIRAFWDLKHELSNSEVEAHTLVHVGDVSDKGTEADLEAGRMLLDELFQASACECIVAIPGNHDRYSSSTTPTGSTLFEDLVLHHFEFADAPDGWGRKSGTWPLSDPLGIRVIGYDFSLETPSDETIPILARFGQGAVVDEVISSLDHLLEGCERTKIVLSHFPPQTDDPFLSLLGGGALVQKVEQLDAVFLICGHTHRCGCGFLNERVYQINVGSATAYGSPNAIAQITLKQENLLKATRVNFFQWAPGDGYQLEDSKLID
ncbi:MAG: metallophosphoesterase family protein [Ruegeria sp.]